MKDSGPRPKFAAILLLDSAGQVGHVGVRRLDQPTDWAAVWQAATAGEISTSLGRWLKSLPAPPGERIAIGSCGIHLGTARACATLLAGWWGVATEGERVRGRRPVGRIEPGGSLRRWRSRADAAADLKLSPRAILKSIRSGRMFDLTGP
jgi:hypothetical protein